MSKKGGNYTQSFIFIKEKKKVFAHLSKVICHGVKGGECTTVASTQTTTKTVA